MEGEGGGFMVIRPQEQCKNHSLIINTFGKAF